MQAEQAKSSRKGYLRKWLYGAAAVVVLVGVAAVGLALNGSGKASAYKPGAPVVRRLTAQQYRTIIADVFGSTVKIGGRFAPGMRVDGLLAVGAGQLSVSPSGMEQYDAMARNIAAQVVDENHRKLLLPCSPKSPTRPDDACAKQFLGDVGRLLFRRPLNEEQLSAYVGAAHRAAETLHDFYTALSLSLAAMMESPQFLFRRDVLEPDPEHPGQFRLDAYSMASRLSFFLWNAAPDRQLLDAAADGELNSRRGLRRQVRRMVDSPRLEAGVRAFFTDWFQFADIKELTKDTQLFPKFDHQVALDAQEQTLRTIVDLLLHERGDYRDLFTTKKTFLTQNLASIYEVPLVNPGPNGSPDRWRPYTFAGDDPRAGILMQASFVALHSHPGRASATERGKALREIMLCQTVPAPPPNVNFDIVQDTSNPKYKTARARLSAHATQPACSGCHKIMDPIGLALENFDAAGGWRTRENGVPIDTSGELDGVAFQDALGLGEAVSRNPAATSCLVKRLSAYALGRPAAPGERGWVDELNQDFSDAGYVLPELMEQIATSEELYRTSAPAGMQPVQLARANP